MRRLPLVLRVTRSRRPVCRRRAGRLFGLRHGADFDEQNALDFRYTWASWQGEQNERQPSKSLPMLFISMDTATSLLGTGLAAVGLRRRRRTK